MNLFKVRIYSIGHERKLGNDEFIDTIIIKRGLIGVEELISEWPVRMVSEQTIGNKHPNSYLREYAYKEFGYDLAIIKEDIISENIATEEEIEEYINTFSNKKIKRVFDQMRVTDDLDDKIKEMRK